MNEFILEDYQLIFDKNERKIEIPKKILYISDFAFANNYKLKKVTFHSKIKKIGKSAFENCKQLEHVKFIGQSELVVIPEKCFLGCENLSNFEIPEEVGIIKKYAFKGCTNIKKIVIPEHVIAIEAGAFDKWDESQTIEIFRNYKFGMVCKANIINHSINDEDPFEEEVFETENHQYMYAVKCKCGHVGRHRYMPIEFAIIADNKKDAAMTARKIPRVKHDHKDAILSVRQIPISEYEAIIEKNKSNPYLKIGSKHEQNSIKDYINEHSLPEPNYQRHD